MPPIRTTPARNRYIPSNPFGDEDHGFNPAWAMKPEPSFTFGTPPAPERTAASWEPSTKLPAPDVVVTKLTSKERRQAFNLENNIDGVTWGVLLPLAFVYNAVKGVSDLATTAVGALGGVAARAGGAVRNRVMPRRHNPMSTTGRRNRTPSRKLQKDSMLALPPHLVGATPNVVRQARGQRLRGDDARTPTIEEARKWKLFHDTPLSKKPRPVPETPVPANASGGPDTPWKTPKFEFNAQSGVVPKAKEFAMNFHKEEFKSWLSVLKKNGSRTTTLRRNLVEKLSFPTDLVMSLYTRKIKNNDPAFDDLVKCFSHEGFTTHYKILVPATKYPPPFKFRKGEIKDIDLAAVRQQADGCCKFCRGFAWAGKVEEREIEQKNSPVPCKSLHKSVVPYTKEENAEFAHHKYDMLFRRWCQESRYDWIFDTPKPTGWEIPKDDPRLRHITMLKQQHKSVADAPKLYDADLVSSYNELRAQLTKQDIAAKVMIDAIRQDNPTLAKSYERMDLERKRRQVKTDWLCVKQVKIIIKNAKKNVKKQKTAAVISEPIPKVSSELAPTVTKNYKRPTVEDFDEPIGPAKPAKRVKFASEPEGPTATGQKTPAKGILKITKCTADEKNEQLKSAQKTSFKRAKTTSFSARKPEANAEPAFLFGAPEIKNQGSAPSDGHGSGPTNGTTRPSLFAAPVPSLFPSAANPKINFNAVPSLAPRPGGGQFFFGAAAKTGGNFPGHLPPAFDPTIIRQQYNKGVSDADSYWDNLKPSSFSAFPNEEPANNTRKPAETQNIFKPVETQNIFKPVEIPNTFKGFGVSNEPQWKPVFKPTVAPQGGSFFQFN